MFTTSIPSAAQAFESSPANVKATRLAMAEAKADRDAADRANREYSEQLLARLPGIILESRRAYPGSPYIRVDSLVCTSNSWGYKPSRRTEVLVMTLKDAGYRTRMRANGLPNARFEWELNVYVLDPEASK